MTTRISRDLIQLAAVAAAGLALFTSPEPARADGDAAAARAAKVKLISAGKKPRRALRYQLRAGAKESVKVSTDMSMTIAMGGMAVPATKIPTIQMEMAVEVKKKLSSNESRYEFEVTDAKAIKRPGVMETIVQAVQQALNSAKGMSGSAIIDTRGFNRDIEVKMPAGLDAQTQQLLQGANKGLDQMSSPFPAEPVGKGARWQVHQVVEQGGMKLNQVVSFKLVELRGNKGTLRVSVKQTAKKQTLTLQGVSAELLRYDGTGSGTSKFDLRRLVPTMNMKLTSDYAMKLAALDGEITGHLDMAMTVSSK